MVLVTASAFAAEPPVPRRDPDQDFDLVWPWDVPTWGDVDQDGIPDPLLAEETRGLVQVWPSSRGSDEPLLWTFDGDCGVDWIAAASTPGPAGLQVAMSRGMPGEVTEYVVDPITLVPRFAWSASGPTLYPKYLGDIDGDGLEDLASATELHLSSDGSLLAIPGYPRGVVGVGDLDDDGHDDVVIEYAWPGFRIEAHQGSDRGLVVDPLWSFDADPHGFDASIGRSILRWPGSDRLVMTVTDDSQCCSQVRQVDVLSDVGTSTPTVVQSLVADWWRSDGALRDQLRIYPEEVGPPSLVLAVDNGFTWFAWDPVLDRLEPGPFASFEPAGMSAGWGPGPLTAFWKEGPDDEVLTGSVWGWTSPSGAGPVQVESDDPRLEECRPIELGSGTTSTPATTVPGPTAPTPPAVKGTADHAPSGCGCDSGGYPVGGLVVPIVVLGRVARRRRAGPSTSSRS